MLQAAYSNNQTGALENFHQPVEDTLIVLRPGPKVFFQYELRFVNRLKSQLLISHLFFPIKEMPSSQEKEARNQAAFWEISPPFLAYPINFYFNGSAPDTRFRGASWFHTLPEDEVVGVLSGNAGLSDCRPAWQKSTGQGWWSDAVSNWPVGLSMIDRVFERSGRRFA
ncbi:MULTISPECIES: hypothetical protein [unclassified Bradyrhizobium]|uniref:hypothetical protein n=1 Tax=unclassified Bradyrhizobium TaxID=2631580 RepID=UPI002FF2668F